ncbi:PREDICTED: APC/C activator protein CDH1-like [Dufourea novaeangliae]|uniref:APC/C activator protein CDH1-like n=1 Tax=Dufourea novaeangliae TaxID=178035 RepID=UPI0007677F42|nr:PREDICTED: APC/C activator protein CDH1-like [Dufourea novaeangliae]
MEAANYLLTREEADTVEKEQLDVFEQVDTLTAKWRKRLMHQQMVKENIISGLGQKKVLYSNHVSSAIKLPGNLATLPRELWDEEYYKNGMWRSKPRNKPLIPSTACILDMPDARRLSRFDYCLVDWSSKDVIAEANQDTVTFFDVTTPQVVGQLDKVGAVNVSALKWNHAGDLLAICTLPSIIELYDMRKEKNIWTRTCKTVASLSSDYGRCICWSQNDQQIVVASTALITSYSAKTGRAINWIAAHTSTILAMTFSHNYHYLASSGMDLNIRIFVWPELAPFIDIIYYNPVKALAWHPQESGLLCVGGGLGDASLSLWDVNKLDPVSYRLVEFYGAVENLAWNKRSGELVVQWSYWEDENRYTIMPVLASLDRIVDVLPIKKDVRIRSIMWNAEHIQLGVKCEESLSMWNFFGDEYEYRHKWQKHRKTEGTKNGTISMNSKEFNRFTIR